MKMRNEKGQTEEEFLKEYNPDKYPKPAVTVDMLVFAKEEGRYYVLLIKRKDHPFLHKYAIPGGFVNMDETVEEAAYRELEEETAVSNVSLKQLYTWSNPARDPRMRVISVSFMAEVEKGAVRPRAGDDAAEAKWFLIEEEVVCLEKEKKTILTFKEELGVAEFIYEVKESRKKSTIRPEKIKAVPKTPCDDLLAFDHGKIIYFALQSLKST